jgi:hypothetical protein
MPTARKPSRRPASGRTPAQLNPVATGLLGLAQKPLTAAALDVDAAIRSAVRAVLPGRQQQRNLEPLVDQARRAFTRTIRRRSARRG